MPKIQKLTTIKKIMPLKKIIMNYDKFYKVVKFMNMFIIQFKNF